MLNPETLERLRAVVGDEHVLTDPDLRAGYESDWTRRYHGETPAIIRPASVAEVSAVVRLCREAGAPLIPQGGNTGLVGGSVPRNGELVLSLRRLDAISDFDSGPGEVTVAAGVTLARLQEFVRGHGWDFGVDLASRDSATIGGMTATNAGGIRVLRYGGMRHQVLGLEAVTSEGAVIRRMPGLLKDNSGYDLPQLLAGSEGTLAVITAVRLKLIPGRPRRTVALLGVQDLQTAIEAVSAVRRALPSLEAAEVFFPEGLDLVCRHTGMPLPLSGAHPSYLLLECA
ncbi:MAG TPA: FAD-binding oxidoreductase, partial [Tepidiformaceae bacterium]|nr:FAD-binding oxidoreductase [Tepidiformaceae bacterium]